MKMLLTAALLLTGCGSLLPQPAPPAALYALDGAAWPAVAANLSSITLLVSAPQAAAGFDSRAIVYVRQPHRRERFARSEWVDTPARMLAPLLVAALQGSGAFAAVVPAGGGAAGALRLDTEILRLQHEFDTTPSRVRFTLRATLLDGATRRVIAARDFEAVAAAASDDPYGGVVAAQAALRAVLQALAAWCAEAALQPGAADATGGRREP